MWKCPKCGEQHEETFEVCWNCGTAIDGTEDPEFRAAEERPASARETVVREPDEAVSPEGFSEPSERSAPASRIIITTTSTVEGRRIARYCGLVSGQAVVRANALRHFLASFGDFGTGRSAAHESELRTARDAALAQIEQEAIDLGASAIVGVDLDYETIGTDETMLLVSVSGTAVALQ
jgi:uncharacterized protein YbjQ (UPF0145 family)